MRDLRDYNSSQWWCKELENIWGASVGAGITHDMKRAAMVAINMVKEVEALHLKNPESWREEYRKKQAAGVKFEKLWYDGFWHKGECDFTGKKEEYREVPQKDVSESFDIGASLIRPAVVADGRNATADDLRRGADILNGLRSGKPTTPHAAERALWKAQREAGTNEIWQEIYEIGTVITTYPVDKEPAWDPNFTYRVKPMKLTAVIVRKGRNWNGIQDWEFTGTREEYRAECDKYGYLVLSEIKEVKPKMVKNYSVLVRLEFPTIEAANDYVKDYGMDIIGDIEEREIDA